MNSSNFVRTLILAGSLLLQLSTLCFQSPGAAGDVDLSFDPGSGVNGAVTAVALQPDGKVIIGGQFTTVKGLARAGIARLNTDGSGDPTFNPGTSSAGAFALQPDGKLIVCQSTNGNGYAVRLNSDGTLDGSFVAAPGSYPYGSSFGRVVVQPDGKVLLGGEFTDVFVDNDGSQWYYSLYLVVRLNANGTSDTSFPSVSGGDYYTYNDTYLTAVALQSDGKVLIGTTYWASRIFRVNAKGSPDSTFNPGTGPNDFLRSVVVQADGKVLIGGYFTAVNGTNRNGIARLNANGSLDSSFNPGVGGAYPILSSIGLQPDGRVLIGGYFTEVRGTNRHGIARLNANGSLDSSFDPGTGMAYGYVVGSFVVQTNGKVLIGGGFTTVNGTNRERIARLNGDGSLDDSFLPGRALDPGSLVGSLVLQPDGKVAVGRVRLNADGSLDSTYTYIQPTNNSPPFPADISVPGSDYSVATCRAVQSDGKVLIGGYVVGTYVDPYDGSTTPWTESFLMRFNADASRDTNFVQNFGFVAFYTYTRGQMPLVVQPDDKILFVRDGEFKRLNANGTPDTNFIAVVGGVTSITLQVDGRIFITGYFAYVNGTSRGGIARLNANGSLDNSFNPGTGANGRVALFVFQPDGKMLIGGEFTTVNGTNRNHIARLNANGSLDLSFNPGTGANGNVSSIALQPDGNVLISGDFTTVNGVLRPHVARLYGDSPWPSLTIARSNASMILSWPVTGLNFQLEENTDLPPPNSWSPVAQSAITNAGQISVTVPASVGRKFYRLKSL